MTDEQRVILAQTGDQDAAAKLAARYEPAARAISALYFLAGGDRDDLRQEARIGLLGAIRDWRPDAGRKFSSFAALCIERQVITAVKTAARLKHRPLSDSARVGLSDSGEPIEIIDLLPSELSLDPHVIVCAKESLADLISRMPRLTPLERRSILGLANGLTYAEVAELNGTHTKVIDNALQRGRAKLKKAA